MRTLFWILLLANVILFAVMQRGGFPGREQTYQPQPTLNADKIRLLDASQNSSGSLGAPSKPAPGAASPAAAAVAPAQLAASAPVVNHASGSKSSAPPNLAPSATGSQTSAMRIASAEPPARLPAAARAGTAAVRQNKMVCFEWGDFSGTDLTRAADMLSALQVNDKVSQREIEYDKGYWVYLPPPKNKAAATKEIARIKSLGVTDYFVVQDAGSMRHAISLGVFKTKETAQNYLKELHAKGLRAATIGERATKLKTIMFLVNNVDASIRDKLADANKDFSGSELKNVPCKH